MKSAYFDRMLRSVPPDELVDFMGQSAFDELIQVDLNADAVKPIYRTEDKYAIPALDGTFSNMVRFISAHVIHPGDREAHDRLLDPGTLRGRLEAADPRGILSGEVRYKAMDGGYRWMRWILVSGEEYGLPAGVVNCYGYDVEAQKHRAEGEQTAWDKRANGVRVDEVTGLLTEKEFFAEARQWDISAQGRSWCIIDIDITHYKLFVEWNGQEMGRYLLREFGAILRRTATECGGLAGYRGQDDFCLLIPYDEKRIQALYEELRQTISDLAQTVGFLPVLGVCVLEEGKDQILNAFNHAALAAEDARGDIQQRIKVYDAVNHSRNIQEFKLLTAFQRAFENGEVTFFLQPQCRVSTGQVVGAESLARWRRKDGTFVSPAVFVPILEKYGIVANLDQFIWESVCQWLRGVIDQGLKPVPVSVNVSQVDVFTLDLPSFFGGLLRKYQLPPELIKIEITESAYVEDTSIVRQTVKKLRDMGLLVLMDDFGSGASSLNMLRTLNVDVIKLDAQFLNIQGQEERKGVSILESVVNMAKNLTTPVIVEGVEKPDQVKFLADLGCRYMQGFYFYRPMPTGDFETLIRNEQNVDRGGFVFKANEQMHAREFLDESIYSDAMLNNILGPVAFYRWQGDNIDIVRYNQQFYEMVGLDVDTLTERLSHMQKFVHPDDLPKFFQMLEHAVQHRITGGSGIFRIYKPNGVMMWISVTVYFIDEDEEGKRFYGSDRDVTELQYIDSDLPGAYYRCTADDGFEFEYISQNFRKLTGYTDVEIETYFDNRLINMVHPKDRERLLLETKAVMAGEMEDVSPYRVRRKSGDYIYLADQSHLTDRFGKLCWQSMTLDVTEVMRLRNQMGLLTRFSANSIVFMRRREERVEYEVVVHGMEKHLGLDAEAFQGALNNGDFARWMHLPAERIPQQIMQLPGGDRSPLDGVYTADIPGRGPVSFQVHFDRITDDSQSVEYIIVFRAAG